MQANNAQGYHGGGAYAPFAASLAQQTCADQCRDDDAGFPQGRDMGHGGHAHGPDNCTVGHVGNQPASDAGAPDPGSIPTNPSPSSPQGNKNDGLAFKQE